MRYSFRQQRPWEDPLPLDVFFLTGYVAHRADMWEVEPLSPYGMGLVIVPDRRLIDGKDQSDTILEAVHYITGSIVSVVVFGRNIMAFTAYDYPGEPITYLHAGHNSPAILSPAAQIGLGLTRGGELPPILDFLRQHAQPLSPTLYNNLYGLFARKEAV